MTIAFIWGVAFGVALDQANTRGWLKLAYDKGVELWKARGVK